MTALQIQVQMNNAYANRSYKKAFKLYNLMNELRIKEGLDFLHLPNLESKFK